MAAAGDPPVDLDVALAAVPAAAAGPDHGCQEGVDRARSSGVASGSDDVEVHRRASVRRGRGSAQHGAVTGTVGTPGPAQSLTCRQSITDLDAAPPPLRRAPMSLRHHEIAEGDHRILDPYTATSKLRLLGEVARVRPEARESWTSPAARARCSRSWASWFGSGGLGVDLSHVFLAAAGTRRTPLGVADARDLRAGRRGRAYGAEPGGVRHRVLPSGRRGSAAGWPGRWPLLRPAVRGRAASSSWASPTGSRSPRPRRSGVRVAAPGIHLAGRDATAFDAAGLEPWPRWCWPTATLWDRYEASHWRTIRTGWPPTRPTRTARRCAVPGREPADVPALGAALPGLGGVRHPAALTVDVRPGCPVAPVVLLRRSAARRPVGFALRAMRLVHLGRRQQHRRRHAGRPARPDRRRDRHRRGVVRQLRDREQGRRHRRPSRRRRCGHRRWRPTPRRPRRGSKTDV